MSLTRNTLSAALCAASLAAPVAVSAQVSNNWQFAVQFYAYLPTISGETTFPADSTSSGLGVSVDTKNILDDLNFVFMGSLQARKGRWGGFTDLLYLDVGNDVSGSREISIGGIGVPAGGSADIKYDLKGTIWTIAGMYSPVLEPGLVVDVFAGARMVDLEQEIDWSVSGNIGSIPLPGRSGGSNVGRTNWDGIVGVKGRVMFGPERRWFVPYYLDVGAGDSDLTWQAMVGIGYSFKWGDISAAWRYLDYDLGSGKPFSDLNLNGPAISVAFRW